MVWLFFGDQAEVHLGRSLSRAKKAAGGSTGLCNSAALALAEPPRLQEITPAAAAS
jgi:hypothetical protein